MHSLKQFLIFNFLLFASLSCTDISSQNAEVVKWMSEEAHPLSKFDTTDGNDLEALEGIVGNARLVCLGESRHDIHEQFELKNRFVKFLIQEMKFKALALEASLPYSNRINDYILHGHGDLEEIMAGMPGWFLWDTREIQELLVWLRSYNADQSRPDKVRFYGIDIVAPNGALDLILEYLQEVDPVYGDSVRGISFAREIIDDNYWPSSLERYAQLDENEKRSLAQNYGGLCAHIDQNRDEYSKASSEEEYEWIVQLAYSAREANRMFSAVDRLEIGVIRDSAMASVAAWVQKKHGKTIIWAHNVHIARSEFEMTMLPGVKIRGMGHVLSELLGDQMVSVGASFDRGAFDDEGRVFEPAAESTIDGTLANLGMDQFILDLRIAPENSSAQDWLLKNNTMRGQEFEMSCIPGQAYDAIFFVDEVSKVAYNPSTLARMRD